MKKYEEQLEKCRSYIRSVSEDTSDLRVKILKGGPYKIKNYYLENNDLDDIRGASANLAYVGDKVIPDIIRKRFDESCIIYNGGGNIFCILPSDTEQSFAIELEKEAQKYLISANVAYVLEEERLSDIQNNYHETMGRVEEKLNARKNMKIAIDFKPESAFFQTGITWSDESVIRLNAKAFDGNELCASCKSRLAGYEMQPEGTKVCGSCLHKKRIGEYIKSYDLLSDIDKDWVALIYGDGNNMGQHIQDFTNILEMMEFSNSVRAAAMCALHETIEELNIQKFDIVGLGGDDVFVIVSGKTARKFTVDMMDKFNEKLRPPAAKLAFGDVKPGPSMSFGICIAKPYTPIRIMLETAKEQLELAKTASKSDYGWVGDNGRYAFTILDSQTNPMMKKNKFGAFTTLQPFSPETAYYIGEAAKRVSEHGKTAELKKLCDVYCTADTVEDAYLFFQHINDDEPRPEYRIPLPNLIIPHEMNLYPTNGGDGFVWKDMLDFIKLFDEVEREE